MRISSHKKMNRALSAAIALLLLTAGGMLHGAEAVVVAVGGGGLISRVAAAIKAMNPACKVYGVEPEGADSMSQSLRAGHPVTLEKTHTIADSLAPPMALPMGFALSLTTFAAVPPPDQLLPADTLADAHQEVA